MRKNSFYIEFGGNTGFYSLNYDRIIPFHPHFKLAPGLGTAYVSISDDNELFSPGKYLYLTPAVSLLIGKQHNVEVGGVYPVNVLGEQRFTILRAGYRYQPFSKNAVVRLAYIYQIPMHERELKNAHGVGFSLGFTF